MGGFAELEVALGRLDGASAAAGLRFSPPNSDAEVQMPGGTVSFDFDALDQLVYDPGRYGRALGSMLLAGEVAGAVDRARQVAASHGVPLRLRLFLDSGAEQLHRLRWEALCDPHTGECLLTNENLLFSRYLSSVNWSPVGNTPKAGQRAVVVVADPKGLEEWSPGGVALTPVAVGDEVARARAGLGAMPVSVLAGSGQATLDGLAAALRDGPDVLYLVCHGFLSSDGPQVLLEKPDGSVDRVAGSDLLARLRELPQLPRLVVLASCQSGGTENGVGGVALAALGPRLAELGVPAVVAMQGNVSMETVAAFMPTFFAELDRDGQIDRAAAVARGRVRDRPDWWMPVLFMRLRSGRLWSAQTAPGGPPRWRRSVPEDLAIFTTPDARRWLTLGRSSYELTDTPDGRLDTVRAIYDALSTAGVRHLPSADAADAAADAVAIASPEQVLRSAKEGTTLDLAMLFSGLCLGNRLLPVVVLLGDEPLVLVWLARGQADQAPGAGAEPGVFAGGLATGEAAFDRLVQLVDGGSFVAVECSGFAAAPALHAASPAGRGREEGILPFDRSRSAGRERLALERDRFTAAVEIAWLQRFGHKVPLLEADERPPAAVVRREAKPPPDPFRHREDELARLEKAMLGESARRVAVVSGMPGVGKSSLVSAFAGRPAVDAAFPQGTLYVDLRATDVMSALDHVAQAFGQSLSEHEALTARVAMARSVLQNARARVLMVVDDASDPDVLDIFRFHGGGLLVTTVDDQLGDQPVAAAVRVEPLTLVQSVDLLDELVEGDPGKHRSAVLERVAAAMGGLPLALALASSLISRGIEAGADIEEVLADLESRRLDLGPRDRPVRAVFDTTYERSLDDRRRGLFARLGAFSPGRLSPEAIAAAWGADSGAAATDLRALTELSLVDSPERGSFELQPLLRDYAVSKFGELDAAERLAVHTRAADHYRTWLRSFEEVNELQTLCYYRFDQASWQEAKAQYLFHLSHLPDRVVDRLAYTGLFFDAFWWFGQYVRFEYCDQLLLEWDRSRRENPDDRRWFEAMKAFVRGFPVGPFKRGRGDLWAALDALTTVRELTGVDGRSSKTDPDERRHVGAVADQFLGQCHQFLDQFDQARECYQRSIDRLEAGSEWWESAWAHYFLADLEVDRRRPEEADRLWRASLSLDQAHPRPDHDVELRANLYRIEADVAWLAGDPAGALASYGLATFYAYRLSSASHPPDFYALAFYREMKCHLARRLGELAAADRVGEAEAGVASLQSLWAPYWASAEMVPSVPPPLCAETVAAVVDGVAPPEPSEAKLTTRSLRYRQEFAKEVADRTAAMAAELDPKAWPARAG
ncbi:MAG: CHAT domain-containing protein [Acidimicrobiales bacterium]